MTLRNAQGETALLLDHENLCERGPELHAAIRGERSVGNGRGGVRSMATASAVLAATLVEERVTDKPGL